MYVNVDSKQPIRFIEGWLEHQIADNSWQRYWCVLKNDVIFLFNNQKESRDTMVGSIAIGPESKLEKLTGDDRNGYTFRLCTKRSLNNFKVAKAIDREMWKAYVEGITSGDVSNDIDLLPGLIEDVRCKLRQYFIDSPQASVPRKTPLPHGPSLKTGFDTPDNSTSGSYDPSGYLLPCQRKPAINPILQAYRFHLDQSRTDVPSWFFSSCSREMAEQILKVGDAYGNTLLRESTSSSKNLVISKRTESRPGYVFTHYIIQTAAGGYKICVENPHEPMETLSELMEFFIETSGRKTTRPMTCNDLKTLGVESHVYNDYNKKIEKNFHDPDSGEEIADAEAGEPSLTKVGPPVSIAPPLPHIPKTAKQSNTKVTAPHAGWNVRSTSVPNFQAHLGLSEQLQVAKPFQVPSKSSGNQTAHILRTNKEVKEIADKFPLPPIPQKNPLRAHQAAPPLPPNHPAPLLKAHSQSAIKVVPEILNINPKNATPKHTQSVSSADIQVRKTSPREQQAASKARDELAQITARIVKQTEPGETTPKPADPAIPEIPKEGLKSPAAASDSFKKKLEGLIGNPVATAPRSRLQGQTEDADDYYESIAHYQNVNVIPNFRH